MLASTIQVIPTQLSASSLQLFTNNNNDNRHEIAFDRESFGVLQGKVTKSH